MVDGTIGPMSRRAISGWQSSKGYEATGILSGVQSIELVTEGLRQRDAFGWATLRDDNIGFSVGFPSKLSSLGAPKFEDGILWYQSNGVFTHRVSIISRNSACGAMDGLYNALLSPQSGWEVTYHARKADWFVVTGRLRDQHFYSRSQCRDDAIVTVTGSVPMAQDWELGFLFTALSNSLSLRPVVNSGAKPAPRLEFPSAAPGYAPVRPLPEPPVTSSAPPPVAPSIDRPDVDRLGKTGAIKLALSDGTELKAKDIFELVSEAVFVVHTADAQGSAVAIGENELLTNCHVLGAASVVELEHDGKRQTARLKSANSADDRCVLTTDTRIRKWVKVRPYSDIKVGERAFSIGAPQGFELTIAEGIVSSKRTIDGDRLLQTSAPISKGSSGGGLFDAQGHLLGVTTKVRKDAQNLNFAIAAEEYAK